MINRRAEMNRRRATEAEALVKFARALVPMSASFPPFPMLRQKMGGSLVNFTCCAVALAGTSGWEGRAVAGEG